MKIKSFKCVTFICLLLSCVLSLLLVHVLLTDSKASAAGCTEFEEMTLFSDDFQDGQADGWSFSDEAGQPLPSPWPVEDDGGNLVLSGSDHQWATIGDRPWTDYRFRLRVKLLPGAVHLNYRLGEPGRYFLGFHEGGLYLNKEAPWGTFTDLASDSQPHTLNTWYTVEISGTAGHLQVYVDGSLRIDVTDPNPVLAGAIGLETLDSAHVHFDDISVTGQICTELRWSQTGALPGGGIVSLEVAITDPDVVFFTTNVNDLGMWRSADAGANWSKVFQGTHGLGVAIHPADPQTTLLLGGHGSIHKTTNGGTSWEEVFEDESKEITDLAYAPTAPHVVYAGTWGGEILKSTNGGDTWSTVAISLVPVAVLSVSPTTPDVVYAGTDNGVIRSTNGGATWINQGPPGLRVISLAGHPTNADVLYAAGDGGLYKTTDGGATWTLTSLANQDVHRVAVATSDPQVIYTGGHNGVSRSTDGGVTWMAVNTGLGYLDIGGLAVSPTDPNTVYVGTAWWQWVPYHGHTYDQPFYGEGIYKTTDGGQSWVKLDGDFADDDALVVIVDPNDASTVYVGTTCSRGGFRSTDSGLTWGLLPGGPEDATDLTHYSMAIAIGTTGARPLYWTGRFGVAKSLDGGLTWQNLYMRRHFHGLAVDPTDSDVVYVGTAPRYDPTEDPWMEGAHIFKSVDGGATWTEMDTGFPHGTETAVHAIVIDPSDPQTLYAATTTHEAQVAYGVYKSTNGGRSWAAVNNGLTVTDVMSLVINPVSTTILYAGTADGVFKTTNGGSSWTAMGLNGLRVEALVIDPIDPDSVYAGTSGGVYKSGDGGTLWYSVNWGLPGEVTGLAIDPQGDRIYAAVPNGGVYRAALNFKPNIKANDSDGPLTIRQGDNLTVTVSLHPGSHNGEDADWWLAAETPFGWYHYDVIGGSWSWIPGISVTYQGDLFDLTAFEVLHISGLPIGSYTFYFGVDMDMNGSLDFDRLYYDSVIVNIQL